MPANELNAAGRIPGPSRRWPTTLPTAAFFAFTLVLFAPAYIFLNNSFDFTFSITAILPVLLLLALSLTVVAFALGMVLKNQWHEKAVALLFALGFLLWLQGNILRWNYGPLDGRTILWGEYATRGLIDASIWVLVLILALVGSKPVYRLARTGSAAFLVMQLLVVGASGWRAPEREGIRHLTLDMSEKHLYSRKQNVIILVLDSFQSDAFQEIIDREPRYKGIFKDFTFFRNNVGGYTGTFFSVPLILTGRYWDESTSIEDYTKNAYLSWSLPFVLKKQGYHAGLYPLQMPDILFSKKIASNFVEKKAIGKAEVAFLLDISLFRQLPQWLKRRVYNDQTWFLSRHFDDPRASRPGKKRKPLVHKKTYRDLNQDREHLEAFEADFRVGERPVFKYWHWQGLHRPLARRENCEYERLEYTRENYLGQAKCLLGLVDRFLSKLKEQGVYDRSMVFVIGDHGVVLEKLGIYIEKDPGQWHVENEENLLMKIRQAAIPLLLVKRISASQPEMNISDAPAAMADIPCTVFAELGINNDAPGSSLFALRENQLRLRPFYVVSGTVLREFRLEKYQVDGFSWRSSSWQKQFSGEDLAPSDD
jgi:hypothetical protein